MQLKVGARLRSAVSAVEVIVVRCPDGDVGLECGGEPMAVPGDEAPASGRPEPAGLSTLGKRYGSDSLEVLVTKGGSGVLSVDGEELRLREPKQMPSSD